MRKTNVFKMVAGLILVVALIVGGCSAKNKEPEPASNNGQKAGNEAPATNEAKTDYPNKPITWIIPLGPGSNTDLIPRAAAKYVQRHLPNNVNIVFENIPGAAGTIGLTKLHSAKPDGYTIAQTAAAAIAIKTVEGTTEYNFDSFQTIANLASVAQFVTVPVDAPYKTFEEWFKYVKENPGFQIAVAGPMNAQQLALEAFASEAGVKLEFVAYDGEGDVQTALLGKHVQGASISQAGLLSFYQEGMLQPIVNITGVKPDEYKDIPTFGDLGYEAEGMFFQGVIAPKGMPDEVLQILVDAFKQTAADPEFKAELEKMGNSLDYKTPEEYQAMITKNAESNRKVMQSLGIID